MSSTLLEESLNNFDFFWAWLQKAPLNSRHPFRYPTVITSCHEIPSARTMVLRDVIGYQLFFFTDIRSPKVMELQENPNLCTHIYDRKKRTQIIVKGTAVVIQEHPKMNMWKNTGKRYPNDYTSSQNPSEPISDNDALEFFIDSFEDHFAVLSVNVNLVEILRLQTPAHQRWRWERTLDDEKWQNVQIVP